MQHGYVVELQSECLTALCLQRASRDSGAVDPITHPSHTTLAHSHTLGTSEPLRHPLGYAKSSSTLEQEQEEKPHIWSTATVGSTRQNSRDIPPAHPTRKKTGESHRPKCFLLRFLHFARTTNCNDNEHFLSIHPHRVLVVGFAFHFESEANPVHLPTRCANESTSGRPLTTPRCYHVAGDTDPVYLRDTVLQCDQNQDIRQTAAELFTFDIVRVMVIITIDLERISLLDK